MNRKNLKLSGIMVSFVIIIISFVYAINIQPAVIGDSALNDLLTDNSDIEILAKGNVDSHSYKLVRFSSYKAFTNFLNNCSKNKYYYWGDYDDEGRTFTLNTPMIAVAEDSKVGHGGTSVDFSQTNIQVEGVDEPDTVKTDGKFLYLVKGRTVFIILAYPAEDAKIVSKISVDYSIRNIFINEDRLVIFGNSNSYYICEDETVNEQIPWYSSSNTYIKVYDVSDREEPVLKRDVVIGGDYFNARMIGDHVYIITNQYQYNVKPNYEDDTIVPLISENGVIRKVPLKDIYCIDIPEYSYTLVHVVSVNVKDDNEDIVDKIFTMGNSQTMYVSRNNIYITYYHSRPQYEVRQEVYDEVLMPLMPKKIKNDIECARNFDISESNKKQVIEWILNDFKETLDQTIKDDIEAEIQRRISGTVIHKISVIKGKIEYMCNGTVPGSILNQFSMDEHNGFFRVATQTHGYWKSNYKKSTNVYILEADLSIVGRVNNIAPGENLHSARFMGKKAYLVTFKKVDPFFTLDLSNPYNPKILGELKIPGYSDYLHPLDENHIIGIGLDTVEPQEEYSWTRDFAWYQGVKIAIFDVTDFENPKVLDQVIIGDRGTTTPVLNEHKAFLFDREKELMVLPISLYEISEEIKAKKDGYTGNTRGQFKLNGAYVYDVSVKDGFNLKGVITHDPEVEVYISNSIGSGRYSPQITRSLYIDNALYTISNNMVKINNLNDLSEISSVRLV